MNNEDVIILVSQGLWFAFLASLIAALLVARSILVARRRAREKAQGKATTQGGWDRRKRD